MKDLCLQLTINRFPQLEGELTGGVQPRELESQGLENRVSKLEGEFSDIKRLLQMMGNYLRLNQGNPIHERR